MGILLPQGTFYQSTGCFQELPSPPPHVNTHTHSSAQQHGIQLVAHLECEKVMTAGEAGCNQPEPSFPSIFNTPFCPDTDPLEGMSLGKGQSCSHLPSSILVLKNIRGGSTGSTVRFIWQKGDHHKYICTYPQSFCLRIYAMV